MVRDALAPLRSRRNQGPVALAAYWPAATVVLAALLAALPLIPAQNWFPDFGYLMFLGWRLLRSDPWPSWWAAPMGLINDVFTGYPIGYSVALWSATMIALDLIDRRTVWRDYWVEWMVAAMLIAIDEALQWRIAKLVGGAPPFASVVPAIAISILAFPLFAFFVGRIDNWRLGR
jgi:rod shape-determining protein MreD